MRKLLWKNKSKQRGQVSIFLVFIFQVLFLFFAMVINVGMLVHHKINLQNSVDLAAYYGAMKQAEILNAIGHINYQIRQSWKLLAFRYNVLGTMGFDNHPSITPGSAQDGIPTSLTNGTLSETNSDVFCMTYDSLFCNKKKFIDPVSNLCIQSESDDNFCRYIQNFNFDSLKVPDLLGIAGWDNDLVVVLKQAKDKQDQLFVNQGTMNYALLSKFIINFRADVRNRKRIIKALAEQLSNTIGNGSGDDKDFIELDGINHAKDGVANTLKKNLAEQNYNSLLLINFYNSMGNANCNQPQGDAKLPYWLNEIVVAPLFLYYDSEVYNSNSPVSNYRGVIKMIVDAVSNIGVQNMPKSILEMQNSSDPFLVAKFQFFQKLSRLAGPGVDINPNPTEDFKDVVGVEKNPWCMTYVGVHATTSPDLPFMPTSLNIKLNAYGFAKPFGGKIGPWYGKTWSSGDQKSNAAAGIAGSKIDERLPVLPSQFASNAITSTSGLDKVFANYSRFPGDKVGLRSARVKQAIGKGVQSAKNGFIPNTKLFNLFDLYQFDPDDLNLNNTDPQKNNFLLPIGYDIMASPNDKNGHPTEDGKAMRILETVGIAPDLFDITYYSIEPNFTALYLKRLLNDNPNTKEMFPRGDLGYIPGNGGTTVMDQMEKVGESPYQIDFKKNGAFYLVFKEIIGNDKDASDPIWGRVLTSWSEKSLLDYDFNNSGVKDIFGKCDEPIPRMSNPSLQDSNPTQGECLKGGRTGYSVKLISRKFLESSDLPLGGDGTSGKILNPPPADF